MTILSVVGIWLAFSLPSALFVGRCLKYCSMFDSEADRAIAAAKAWSEVHESFPINSGM